MEKSSPYINEVELRVRCLRRGYTVKDLAKILGCELRDILVKGVSSD